MMVLKLTEWSELGVRGDDFKEAEYRTGFSLLVRRRSQFQPTSLLRVCSSSVEVFGR